VHVKSVVFTVTKTEIEESLLVELQLKNCFFNCQCLITVITRKVSCGHFISNT
jgi:hypothetical protein